MSGDCAILLKLFSLSFISLVNVASAGAVTEINLSEIEERKSPLVWQPSHDGLTRYQLTIPQKGIDEAIQFRDTSALFYMSTQTDNGIALVQQDNAHLTISMSEDVYGVQYSKPISSNLTFDIGTKIVHQKFTPIFGLSFRSVISHLSLDEFSILYKGDYLDTHWSRSILSDLENSETMWTLEKRQDQFLAGWGYRWFDVIDGYDILGEASFNGKNSVVTAQFETDFGSLNSYFGGQIDLSSKEALILLGGTWSLNRDLSLSISKKSTMLSTKAQSLKSVRRAMLSSYWRSYVRQE